MNIYKRKTQTQFKTLNTLSQTINYLCEYYKNLCGERLFGKPIRAIHSIERAVEISSSNS